MVISLLQEFIFGMLPCLLDNWVVVWELDALNINVLRFIDVRSILEDLPGVNWDCSPSIDGDVVGAHVENSVRIDKTQREKIDSEIEDTKTK